MVDVKKFYKDDMKWYEMLSEEERKTLKYALKRLMDTKKREVEKYPVSPSAFYYQKAVEMYERL